MMNCETQLNLRFTSPLEQRISWDGVIPSKWGDFNLHFLLLLSPRHRQYPSPPPPERAQEAKELWWRNIVMAAVDLDIIVSYVYTGHKRRCQIQTNKYMFANIWFTWLDNIATILKLKWKILALSSTGVRKKDGLLSDHNTARYKCLFHKN